MPEALTRYTLWVGPPCTGHYMEYSPGGCNGLFNTQLSLWGHLYIMNFLLILTTATIKVHMFDLNKLLNIIVKMIKMEVKKANVIVKNNNINGHQFYTLQWSHSPVACGSILVLKFFLNFISLDDENIDQGNLLSICDVQCSKLVLTSL